MTEETVGWIDAQDDPVEAADDPQPARPMMAAQPSAEDTQRRTAALGRIAVALVVAWTALVAIPGGVPWATSDDTARALAYGIGIASVVALVGLVLAWFRTDQLGVEGATFGTAAALAALGLAALEVLNLMILPSDAAYRPVAVGIGLLVLLAVALVTVTAIRTNVFSGFRPSTLTLIGTVIGVVVVAAYLIMIQTMVSRAGGAQDDEWTRLTTLLTGLQTLAFAGLGALLGIAVQHQITSKVKDDLADADAALRLLETEAGDIIDELRRRGTQSAIERETVILEALRQDPARLKTEGARRRWLRANEPDEPDATADLADSLAQVLASARRMRAG